ncbi:hypothetical protein VDG1235_1463 [Verrucomicrobiia bacterium DG1235]|nr:hypothetical protein VDG1235_1463 [Verrucomicrobiae bacterium DG1235]
MLFLLAVASSKFAFGGTVQTKDGSFISGKILSIEEGAIKIETSFAGTIEVKQSDVSNFSTEDTINLSTSDGNTLVGTVEGSGDELLVSTEGGSFETRTDQISHAWQPGQDSPADRALKAQADASKRSWKYNASVDISGKSGNSDRSAMRIGASATLQSSEDRLRFYLGIDKGKENDSTTADEIKGGIDYSAFFSDTFSWYARTELETDDIELLDLRSTTAFGIGKHVLQEDDQSLEVRGGLAYRFESFQDGSEVESPGLDLSLIHSKDFTWGSLNNLLNYNPSFEDFGNFRVYHESSLDLPVGTGEFWTLRVGLSNDYNSEPLPGLKEMDTTYFTRLLLKWK